MAISEGREDKLQEISSLYHVQREEKKETKCRKRGRKKKTSLHVKIRVEQREKRTK